MRFLKNKIALAVAAFKKKELEQKSKPASSVTSAKKKRERILGFSFTQESSRATKNIVKNYGKAICTFAVSNAAIHYLISILEKEQLGLEDFTNYINQTKDSIDGLRHFRSIL